VQFYDGSRKPWHSHRARPVPTEWQNLTTMDTFENSAADLGRRLPNDIQLGLNARAAVSRRIRVAR
jgi:hypothetical protein